MQISKKSRRPAAETPKGFRDYFGAEVTARTEMLRKAAEVFERFGFQALETSAVENLDALGKFLPDVDRPNEGVFAWKEDDGWSALRYDLTAPLARVAAQYRNDLPSPYRRYAIGPVWRNEKPGPGRFRQFYQCDADTVGSSSPAADAEMCLLAGEVLEAVGIERGGYVVRINDRRVLDGALEAAGVVGGQGDEQSAAQRGIVLRAMDKLDRIGPGGVAALLGKGRKDESGDYTEGAGLSAGQIDVIMALLEAGRADVADTLSELASIVEGSETGAEGVRDLNRIADLLIHHGFGPDRMRIDPSVVRGLEYYTGPVLEAELVSDAPDDGGQRKRLGSVAGGGRYDGLVRRFTGQDVPATGVSIGVDRILAALGKAELSAASKAGPVVVTVMDRNRMHDYMVMAAELREAGIPAEVFLGNARNFGRQMKYADQRNSPAAVIQGTEERKKGVVQVKDLRLGAQIARTATHEEWKKRPSQFEVPRGKLVAGVRRLLENPTS